MGAEQSKAAAAGGGKPSKTSRSKLFSRKKGDKHASSSTPSTPKNRSPTNFNSGSASSTPTGASASTSPSGASSGSTPSGPGAKPLTSPVSSPSPKQHQDVIASSVVEKEGLPIIDFMNVETKTYLGRIDLMHGVGDQLAACDETDCLFVYKNRRTNKANHDSAMALVNKHGYNLEELKNDKSNLYESAYSCWLSKPIADAKKYPTNGGRPKGFNYKRFLVFEDGPDENGVGTLYIEKEQALILQVMKCFATVAGGEGNVDSVMIPLMGQQLSAKQRKKFVTASTIAAHCWLQMGLPIRQVKILLPEGDATESERKCFRLAKSLCESKLHIDQVIKHDIFFSYCEQDKEAAHEMMEFLKSKNPSIRIYDNVPRGNDVIESRVLEHVVEIETMAAISQSRLFFSVISKQYFESTECTEHFALAACRDVEADGSFALPVWWRQCDLNPLAKRLIETEGYDCREADIEKAKELLLDISAAIEEKNASQENNETEDVEHEAVPAGDGGNLNIFAEKRLMEKEHTEEKKDNGLAELGHFDPDGKFFSKTWIEEWGTPYNDIVFGPRIGAGGFGEVYKCKWKSKMVAVKTLQKIEDEDPEAVYNEFMIEMKLMSKLHHDHVVKFLGASVEQPSLAIILEFMAGGSLYRAISRRRRNGYGPFPLLKSLWIAFGISKGMTYLHAQDPCVVHRDLKSPNILLGTNVREVKVTDFGLSRVKKDSYVRTGPGGTPEWMAPELLRQEPFDELSDVFSFGVILWELMMCEKPWKDDHPMQIVFKVGSRGEILELPPPSQCIPEVREMIGKCFLKDPKKRPTFAELTKKLDELCHNPEYAKKAQK